MECSAEDVMKTILKYNAEIAACKAENAACRAEIAALKKENDSKNYAVRRIVEVLEAHKTELTNLQGGRSAVKSEAMIQAEGRKFYANLVRSHSGL